VQLIKPPRVRDGHALPKNVFCLQYIAYTKHSTGPLNIISRIQQVFL